MRARSGRNTSMMGASFARVILPFMFLRRGLVWLQNQVAIAARNFLLSVLAAGPIPKHVGFVMDGNRRYARRKHQAVQQGHSEGFVALRRVSPLAFL